MNRTLPRLIIISQLLIAGTWASAAQEIKPLFDFEDNDVGKFEPGAGAQPFAISDQHATSGKSSIRVPCENTGYLVRLVKADWSGYDELQFDVFVEGEAPVKGSV
ncbi:MAG: hypothetical protein H0V44_02420, partial [Planctomycetes bacterium]|nr:hypothetical protein [Planctomycetota bacterium]